MPGRKRSAVAVTLVLLLLPAYALSASPRDGGGAKPRHDGGDGGHVAASPDIADPTTEGDTDDLPADHPAVETASPHGSVGNGGGMPGVFQPPEDTEQDDPTLPPGSISVDLHDADDKPVVGEVVTLGILINSIANGDSRKHLQTATDARGHVVFSGLEMASNIAYRVSSGYEGGSFGAMPFQLPQGKARHVLLHVYKVTRDLRDALVVCEAAVAAEMRDDRIQVEEALTLYNLGRTAWQPDDVQMALPPGEKAFGAQASMSDQGVDEVNGSAKLRGTFAPGQHSIEFRWQLPWSGDKDVDFDVGLPPHVAIARVIMAAAGDIKLSATDFPPAEARRNAKGQSFLVTERRLRPDQGTLSSLSISIRDLPTPGPGRLIASCLAALGVTVGLGIALSGRRWRRSGDPERDKTLLLDDLLSLEHARIADEVGPRTYERARRELVDALATALSKAAPRRSIEER